MSLLRGSGIQQSSTSSGISPATALVTTVTDDLIIGANTIPHGRTTEVYLVTPKDANNRVVIFSNIRWDATNIYVTSPAVLANITFVIEYASA